MNPNRKTNIYVGIVSLALLAGIIGAHEYQPEEEPSLRDPISVRSTTEQIPDEQVDSIRFYSDKAAYYDHQRFLAKSNVE